MRPRLRVVPDELIAPIIGEAERILAEIGVEVRGARMRQRLLDHGLKLARTADDAERVLFPPEVVRRAIAAAPKAFPLYDRDGAPYTELGGAIWPPRSPPTTSSRRSRTRGGCIWC